MSSFWGRAGAALLTLLQFSPLEEEVRCIASIITRSPKRVCNSLFGSSFFLFFLFKSFSMEQLVYSSPQPHQESPKETNRGIDWWWTGDGLVMDWWWSCVSRTLWSSPDPATWLPQVFHSSTAQPLPHGQLLRHNVLLVHAPVFWWLIFIWRSWCSAPNHLFLYWSIILASTLAAVEELET